MTFKKMLLVASMAFAAIAFAAPASASAEWTDNGAPFVGTASDTLTGTFGFGDPAAGKTKFVCFAHAGISADGGTTTGSLNSFAPTTDTCQGEGTFAGCKLEDDSTTGLPTALNATGTNSATVSNASIVIHYIYDDDCPIEESILTVAHLNLNLNGTANFTDATVSGLALAHSWVRFFGQVTQSVAVFGTMHTASDTLSIK